MFKTQEKSKQAISRLIEVAEGELNVKFTKVHETMTEVFEADITDRTPDHLKPLFKNIKYQLMVTNVIRGGVTISYRYEHPNGGGNGYSFMEIFLEDGEIKVKKI